jgi:hypothetical protein
MQSVLAKRTISEATRPEENQNQVSCERRIVKTRILQGASKMIDFLGTKLPSKNDSTRSSATLDEELRIAGE